MKIQIYSMEHLVCKERRNFAKGFHFQKKCEILIIFSSDIITVPAPPLSAIYIVLRA